MAVVSELDLPVFDYTDPALRGPRFHEVMREQRERGWLAASPLATFVLDRDAISFFLRSRETTFPGMKVAEIFGVTEGPLYEEISRNLLHLSGDQHRRLRNLVNPAFTPRAADRWRPVMREYLEELWGRVGDARQCEFVSAFARPYPAMMIATVVGAPLEDAPRLERWSNLIQSQFAQDLLAERDRIEQAVVEFYAWATEVLAERRDKPADDLISALLAAEEDGDRLSDRECLDLVLNVLIGGVDTTQSQLAHAIRLFAEHPDQWELLRARPELSGAAVEEVVRYEPITPFTARIVLSELEYDGVVFPEGTILMLATGAGNRDAEAYESPEDFDIAADRGSAKPLTFGAGIHYCLGANLARAELQVALTFLSARMPGLALDGAAEFDSIHGIYGLDALPVRWVTPGS
jgi:cytochrome P450